MKLVQGLKEVIDLLKCDHHIDQDLNVLFQLLMPMAISAEAGVDSDGIRDVLLCFPNEHHPRYRCFFWSREKGLHGNVGTLMLQLFRIVSEHYNDYIQKQAESTYSLLKNYSAPVFVIQKDGVENEV